MRSFAQFITEARTLYTAGTYRLYHGSKAKFSTFRTLDGEIWFTTDRATALAVAQANDTSGYLYTVDVTFHKPVVGVYGEEDASKLKRHGFDGYMLPHTMTASGFLRNTSAALKSGEFDAVAFDPSQVSIISTERV